MGAAVDDRQPRRTSSRSSCRAAAGRACCREAGRANALARLLGLHAGNGAPARQPRDRGGRLRRLRLRRAPARRRRRPVPRRATRCTSRPASGTRSQHRRRGRGHGLRLPAPRLPADRAPVTDLRDAPRSVREQVAWACRILALEGFADLTLGHVSARPAGGETIYIKRKGSRWTRSSPTTSSRSTTPPRPSTWRPSSTPSLPGPAGRRRDRPRPPSLRDCLRSDHGRARSCSPTTPSCSRTASAYFEETSELITDEEQGRAVAAALGHRRAVLLRNHGVVVADEDVRWAVLSAITLERAVRLQAIATALGELRPIPRDDAERMRADKYQDDFVDEYWAAWIRSVRCAAPTTACLRNESSSCRSTAVPVVREIEPQELLLDFLRERLGLTGAKRSCDVQVCGTCTVLVDGLPVSSCCFLAADADGREVLTIEGLAERPEFERLEDAFTRHAALQCGFCTPGHAADGRRAARDWRADERGGDQATASPATSAAAPGYRGILEAVCELARSRGMTDGRLRDDPSAQVGRSVAAPGRAPRSCAARRSSRATSSCRACCTARCCARPVAHARIVSIDASEAERMPGVVCVLTARRPRTTSTPTGVTRSRTGRSWRSTASASRGEPVAAVAAEDEATAQAALERIHVEYEELPVVGHGRAGAGATTRRCVHDGPLRPGLFHGLGELTPADGQRLLPLPHRPRGDRGGLRPRRHRGRRRVHVPRRLPVRDGDAHGRRPGRGRRDHALGLVPAPVPRARRDRRPVPACRSRTCASSSRTSAAASARSRTRRWSRSPSRSRARRGARCGSRTASPSRW